MGDGTRMDLEEQPRPSSPGSVAGETMEPRAAGADDVELLTYRPVARVETTEQEFRARVRQQASVAELGQYALASNDLSALLHEAVGRMAYTLGVEYGAIWELSPEGSELLLRAGVGWRAGFVGEATVDVGRHSLPGYTLLSYGPVIVQDLPTETRFTPSPLLCQHHRVVSGLSVIIQGKDRPFGVLSAHSACRQTFTPDDIHFLQAVAHVLATAIERTRAEEERARYSQVLTTRVLEAEEDERKRIARDLHDETVQALSTLLVNLDLLEPHIPPGSSVLATGFERVRAVARRALEETRKLAHALRPTVLDDLGLTAALHGLAEEYTQTYGLQVEVQIDPKVDDRLAPEGEVALFRIAQEALTNACKHAAADFVKLRLALSNGDVAELVVEDNGRGFDLEQTGRRGWQSGLGLHSMRERAALLGGELHIQTAPGKGTRVVLHIPPIHPPAQPSKREGESVDDGIPSVTVLLVDDHAMFREGLRRVLDTESGIRVIGEAEDGRQAVEMVERLRPDVVVMDIAMPNLNGLDATRQIKRHFPNVKVVILTTHESRPYLVQMVKVGATACVLKRSAGNELLSAIRASAEGKSYISPTIAGLLLEDHRLRIEREGEDLLTEREREVLQLAAEGRTNQEIAQQLVVSIKTVEAHRAHIMRKLGVHDRADLVKYAIRMGMISPD